VSGLRCLGVLLCYNDGDLLAESISYLLDQNHDLIAWDHGSSGETPDILERFRADCVEVQRVPREFDFYEIYPAMSRHLISNYVSEYDWIFWPDQDEFLEARPATAPTTSTSSRRTTPESTGSSPTTSTTGARRRTTRASRRPRAAFAVLAQAGLPPRIRSWRARVTNIRRFNHNPLEGTPSPRLFNLRHYPMRSPSQMRLRVLRDRAGSAAET